MTVRFLVTGSLCASVISHLEGSGSSSSTVEIICPEDVLRVFTGRDQKAVWNHRHSNFKSYRKDNQEE